MKLSNRHIRSFFSIIALFLFTLSSSAQDTLKRKEVNITSTFKPTLKEAAKINIQASPPAPDTTPFRLQYSIPSQNLNFAFQPGTLKPLALQSDSGGKWDNESYVKAGFGSLKTPFLQAGLSLGNGKTMGFNVYGKHYSSEGKIPLQNVSHTNVDLTGFYQNGRNGEITASFGGEQERYNRYGFDAFHNPPPDSIRIKYQNWRGRIGYRNVMRTSTGISYALEARIDAFSDELGNSESTGHFNVPFRKTIGTSFEALLGIEANYNRYTPKTKEAVNNTYFLISPAVLYKSGSLFINAGLKPSWNNGTLSILPNVFAEFNSRNANIAFQLGWVANLRSNSFHYLASFNPWIWAPDSVNNSRIEERFAGIKGSVGDHFSYSIKAAYNNVTNQPLFVNDTINGSSFQVLIEPKMNVVNFGAELGFNIGEKFSILSSLNLNKYKPKIEEKAWGLLPLEFRTDIRLQVLKDLYATVNVFAFDGPQSRDREGVKKLGGAMDLSGGLEFKVIPNLKVWAQFNNILNQEYQRWNHYPVYGFNILAGVVFSFAQKN